MGLVNTLKQRLDLYRLEQRYTKNRQHRTHFASGARYVDGVYIYDTPHDPSSGASSPTTPPTTLSVLTGSGPSTSSSAAAARSSSSSRRRTRSSRYDTTGPETEPYVRQFGTFSTVEAGPGVLAAAGHLHLHEQSNVRLDRGLELGLGPGLGPLDSPTLSLASPTASSSPSSRFSPSLSPSPSPSSSSSPSLLSSADTTGRRWRHGTGYGYAIGGGDLGRDVTGTGHMDQPLSGDPESAWGRLPEQRSRSRLLKRTMSWIA